MKFRYITHTYIVPVVACLCLGLSAVSCVDDEIGCVEDRPGYVEGNDIWLSLSVVNQGSADRASRSLSRADDPAGHPDEAASIAENYINTDDVTLMLLNDRGVLMKVFDKGEFVIVPRGENIKDYSVYDITFRVNRDYFSYAGADINFSLMVVANANGMSSGHGNPFTWQNVGRSAASLSMTADNYFDFPDNYDISWQPDIDAKRHIPMAGISKVKISRVTFEAPSSAENRLDLGVIDMQRALAKVRVLDGIASQTDTELSEITGVKISGLFKTMALVPYSSVAPGWYTADKTPVIESGSAPADAWGTTATIPFYKEENFKATDGTVYKQAFIAYVPEYSAAARSESDRNNASTPNYESGKIPTLHIDAASRFSDGLRTYDLPITDGRYNFTDMARNHIYEFTVKANPMAQLKLEVNVKDWTLNEEILDFTDHPSFNGEILWHNYRGKDGTGIVVKNNEPANVTFRFSTPVDCRWTAYLIPVKGNGAFVFTDKDGNPLTENGGWPTGIIGGDELQTLYIKATNPGGVTDEVSAELCVMVTTQDNTEVEADLTKGSNGRFLIRQLP